MARTRFSTALLPVLLVAALCSSHTAAAQTVAVNGLRFTAPFAFSVDTVTLPAGNYTVQWLSATPGVVRLRNDVTQESVLMPVRPGNAPAKAPYQAGVTFQRRGDDTYRIASLWDASAKSAVDAILPTSDGVVTTQTSIRIVPATK